MPIDLEENVSYRQKFKFTEFYVRITTTKIIAG
jgi:hypothetical protein